MLIIAVVTSPLAFEPIFVPRVWGGRGLDRFYRSLLPADPIGEAWTLVDRPEAQSRVRDGEWRGCSLHDLWVNERAAIFGDDAPDSPRFPLLIKVLDCREKLSLQVHPPAGLATELGGEAKTEAWYIIEAGSEAELFLGTKKGINRESFAEAVRDGRVAACVQPVPADRGQFYFVPSGRVHSIGGGNLIMEVQQNSDTTYRVFDWNRRDDKGKPRQLHVEQALESIDFTDVAPKLTDPKGETLVKHELFEIQKWNLDAPREIIGSGQFAIVCCLTGGIRFVDVDLRPGEFLLVPASLPDRQLEPRSEETTLLRITIPGRGD